MDKTSNIGEFFTKYIFISIKCNDIKTLFFFFLIENFKKLIHLIYFGSEPFSHALYLQSLSVQHLDFFGAGGGWMKMNPHNVEIHALCDVFVIAVVAIY